MHKMLSGRRMSLAQANYIAERRRAPTRTQSMQFIRRTPNSPSPSPNATMTTGSPAVSFSSSLSSVEDFVPASKPVAQIPRDTRCVWLIVHAETFHDTETLLETVNDVVETTLMSSIRCGVYLIYSPQDAENDTIARLRGVSECQNPWRPSHTVLACTTNENGFTRTATISLAFTEILASTPAAFYTKTTIVLVLGKKASVRMKSSVCDWLAERHAKTILVSVLNPIHDQIKDLIISYMKKRKRSRRKKRKGGRNLKG